MRPQLRHLPLLRHRATPEAYGPPDAAIWDPESIWPSTRNYAANQWLRTPEHPSRARAAPFSAIILRDIWRSDTREITLVRTEVYSPVFQTRPVDGKAPGKAEVLPGNPLKSTKAAASHHDH